MRARPDPRHCAGNVRENADGELVNGEEEDEDEQGQEFQQDAHGEWDDGSRSRFLQTCLSCHRLCSTLSADASPSAEGSRTINQVFPF